ncbi:MAG: hypothetical protein KJZ86_08935 [Caldilineaceae bacterium]|nr:hypothetical protein [Anaerolinea sp.]MCL4832552.1 hypothetical protein [Caldilineaceae bacterium]HRJ43567.1 hypothetical protein [Caldilineaceae bacterium]
MRDYIDSLPQLAGGLMLAALLYFLLDSLLGGDPNPFFLWLFCVGLITFAAYGIDTPRLFPDSHFSFLHIWCIVTHTTI